MPENAVEPLFKWLAIILLIAGCAASSSPTTTEPPPRWCPHTDPDSGQRYYTMDCE